MRREQPVRREDVPAAALGTASPTFMRASRAFVGGSALSARSSRTSLRTTSSYIDTDDSSEEHGASTAATTPEDAGPYRSGDFTPPKRAPSTPKKSLFKRIFSSSPKPAPVESDAAPKDGKIRRKRLISAQSPEAKWPKTWAEYDKLYARGRIDVNDPPPPPPASTWTGEGPAPNERQVYQAPEPFEERARQTVRP